MYNRQHMNKKVISILAHGRIMSLMLFKDQAPGQLGYIARLCIKIQNQ